MKVGAVVLAAGRGRRMGGSKHLLRVDGVPLLARVLETLARLEPIAQRVAVLREGDLDAERLALDLGAEVAWVPADRPGRSASVRAGVAAIAEDRALLVALADQPFLSAADFQALIAAPGPERIVHARYHGQRGTPVLFGAVYRVKLMSLRGSEGGRAVIEAHPEDVQGVDLDPLRGRDLDRPEDLEAPS
jgi:molybdenum cofactor cytidylyltransferase